MTARPQRCATRAFPDEFGVVEQPARIDQQVRAGVGKFDVPLAASKQLRADLLFEPAVYASFPLWPGTRSVVCFHDTIAESFPRLVFLRIWVQLATGRDKSALGFDWRRLARQAETAFRGRQPSVSAWGQSNRLLAGPFESEAAANAYITQLRRADVTGMFVWTSPAGQVVDGLPLR